MLPGLSSGSKHIGEVRGDFLDQVDFTRVWSIGLAKW